MIVTFYSFKGGVGRTMALANVGEILADWGYRVVLCDWDLEAPGLERYFSPVDSPWFGDPAAREAYDRYYKDMLAHEGLMELLRDYKQTLTKTPPDGETPEGGQPDYVSVGKLMLRRPSAWTYVPPTRMNDDRLRILSAGRRENEERLRQYAEEVRDFDWTEFYEKWAGNAYIEFFRKELKGEHGGNVAAADIVLVDSRTGVTEQGGVCTHHLADLVVLTTAPNEANVDGTAWMASSLTRNEKLEAMRGDRPLAVLPVISRVEVFNERELYDDFEEYFIGRLTPYLPKAITEGSEFFKESRIPYATFYSFRERVVAREARERRQRELYRAYMQLAHAVVRHGLTAGILAEDHTPAELRRATTPLERPRRTLRGPVFISHASEDVEVAAMVAEALRKRGVPEVLPALPVGVGITADAAQSILSEAGTVFFLVGENGISESMRAELDFIVHLTASGKQTTIVPLMSSASVFPSPLLVGYRAFVLPPDARSNAEFFDDLISETSAASVPTIVSEDAKPYPGMAPFRESDARFFFGRDDEIADLETTLADAATGPIRWLRVEGASGIGVSSIVNAGLIPAIRRGAVHGIGRDAVVAVCSASGTDPLLSLATALAIAPGIRVEEVRAQLKKPDLAKYVELLLRNRSAILVIESLDEVAGRPAAARSAFCDAIAKLLAEKELPLSIVSTMRSGDVVKLADTPLTGIWRKAKVLEVLPIDAKRLRDVIVGPAALVGMAFETGLPERIIDETSSSTNCPSLLASNLNRLWKAAKNRNSALITHAMYEECGGISPLVVQMTEDALRGFRGIDREIAQSILLRLVSGVETRLARAVVALVAGPGVTEARELVLNRLADARLLSRGVRDDVEEAELTHDAVLLAPTMAKWIDDERSKIRQRSELELAARSWREARKPFGGLPTGGQLRYFERVETTSPDVGEYLAAARLFTLLRRVGFTAVTLLGALVLWWGIRTSRLSPSRNDFADFLLHTQPVDRSLLLKAALDLEGADAEHTNRLLRYALNASVAPQTYVMNKPIVAFDLSGDGHVLAIAQSDQVDVYDVARHALIMRLMSQGTLTRVTLSNGGSLLFVHHSDRLPEVWDVLTGKVAWQVPPSLYSPGAEAVMSRDGQRVAMADPSHELIIFSIPKSGVSKPKGFALRRVAQSLAFTPDGNRIIGFGRQGFWVRDRDGVLVLDASDDPFVFDKSAFSDDGQQMATYVQGLGLLVLNLDTGKTRERLDSSALHPVPASPVGVAIGWSGTPVVLAYDDGTLLFHRIPSAMGGDRTIATGSVITSIAAASGPRFVIAGKETLELWSAVGTRIMRVTTDRIAELTVGLSGNIVAGKLDSGAQLRVWDFNAMQVYTASNIPDSQLRSLAEQRRKELAVTVPQPPAHPDAATASSPESLR